MTRTLTPPEAWQDFWEYVISHDVWKDIPRKERQYLYKTGKAMKQGKVGARRLVSVFETYRPNHYILKENFEISDK